MNEICATRGGQWMRTCIRWCGRAALVGLLGLAACTHTGKPGPTVTPSLHAPSAGPSSLDPRSQVQAATAAYTNLLNAYTTASNSGTTDTTELARYATGDALQVLASGLAGNKAKGLHSQGTPVIAAPRVNAIAPTNDPSTVNVTGCVDDTHWQLYNSKGQMVDSGPSGRRATSAQIDRSGATWKVSSLAIQGAGTCTG